MVALVRGMLWKQGKKTVVLAQQVCVMLQMQYKMNFYNLNHWLISSIPINCHLKVDCVWASWSTWSTCSVTCGTGTRVRGRVISVQEVNGGVACTGDSIETLQENCGTCTDGIIYILLLLLLTIISLNNYRIMAFE